MIYISKNERLTYDFAENLAKQLVGGEVITLNGQLGVGKTIFAKGLAHGLGVTETVLSPTFTIMNEYKSGRLILYHYDAYRLECEQIDETGITEHFGGKNCVCLIEWAQNISSYLPKKTMDISIKYLNENEREIQIND